MHGARTRGGAPSSILWSELLPHADLKLGVCVSGVLGLLLLEYLRNLCKNKSAHQRR